MFKVGDLVTGTTRNGYGLTNSDSLLLVVATDEYAEEMNVIIIAHKVKNCIGQGYGVKNSRRKFISVNSVEEWTEGVKYIMDNTAMYNLFRQYPRQTEEDCIILEEDTTETGYKLSPEMRKSLIKEMTELLLEYDYHPTEDALNKILDEWCVNKAYLIRLFEKHPNYNGRFQIVFSHDYSRDYDMDAVTNFRRWLCRREIYNYFRRDFKVGPFYHHELNNYINKLNDIIDIFRSYPDIMEVNYHDRKYYETECNRFYNHQNKYYENEIGSKIVFENGHAYEKEAYKNITKLDDLDYFLRQYPYISQTVNENAEDFFRRRMPEMKIKKDMRLSRALNKIFTSIGVNKFEDYNKEFAKLSDAINPLKVKRHTILSVHPIDYLTMSFGNSWNSCHTIDRENKRNITTDNHYRGCNSSGTMSYMLDETSSVFYTVDAAYDGEEFELQNKINRCMFHYYDHRLVQGRVYPQSNDSYGESLYKDIREIVQKLFADMLEVPNMWTNKKGISVCEDTINSYGTHYKDYENFSTCNVSALQDGKDFWSHKIIPVGHNPICPCCGYEHYREKNIECNDCSF